jgi:hypothetical protein
MIDLPQNPTGQDIEKIRNNRPTWAKEKSRLEDRFNSRPATNIAIWRGDEYIPSFLFAIRLQFQPTNNAAQLSKQ